MASIQGWGRETWGSGAWGQFAPVEATGNGLTSTTGTASTITSNVFGANGNSVTSSVGSTIIVSTYALTGVGATSSTDDVSVTNDNISRTGWGRGSGAPAATASSYGWGEQAWGNSDNIFSVTGNGLTSSLGEESLTGDANITLTAEGLTSTAGDAVAIGIAEVTIVQAQTLTSNTNDVASVTGTASVSPTANGLTASLGEESILPIKKDGVEAITKPQEQRLVGVIIFGEL